MVRLPLRLTFPTRTALPRPCLLVLSTDYCTTTRNKHKISRNQGLSPPGAWTLHNKSVRRTVHWRSGLSTTRHIGLPPAPLCRAQISSFLHGLLPFFCHTTPPFQQSGPASPSDNDAPPPLGRWRVHRFVSSDFGKPLITRQPEHLLGLGRVHPSRADFDGVRKRAAQDEVRRPRD